MLDTHATTVRHGYSRGVRGVVKYPGTLNLVIGVIVGAGHIRNITQLGEGAILACMM